MATKPFRYFVVVIGLNAIQAAGFIGFCLFAQDFSQGGFVLATIGLVWWMKFWTTVEGVVKEEPTRRRAG